MASISIHWFLKSRLYTKSRLFNAKFHFGHNILYLKFRLYVQSRLVKSRFNCWHIVVKVLLTAGIGRPFPSCWFLSQSNGFNVLGGKRKQVVNQQQQQLWPLTFFHYIRGGKRERGHQLAFASPKFVSSRLTLLDAGNHAKVVAFSPPTAAVEERNKRWQGPPQKNCIKWNSFLNRFIRIIL